MFMAILALFVVYIFVYFRLIDQTMFVVTETNFHRKAQKYTNKPKMVFPLPLPVKYLDEMWKRTPDIALREPLCCSFKTIRLPINPSKFLRIER